MTGQIRNADVKGVTSVTTQYVLILLTFLGVMYSVCILHINNIDFLERKVTKSDVQCVFYRGPINFNAQCLFLTS